MVAVVTPGGAALADDGADQLAVDLVKKDRLEPWLELLEGDAVALASPLADLVEDVDRPGRENVDVALSVLAELGGAYLALIPFLGPPPTNSCIAR
jgi:hypothetical protein